MAARRPPNADLDGLVANVESAFNHDQEAGKRRRGIKDLAAKIETAQWTSDRLVESLEQGCRFCEAPELSLHYYHAGSCDHDAFVYNDETLEDVDVLRRVQEAMEEPVGQAEACELRKSLSPVHNKKGRLAACASCNEYLVPEWGDTFETRSLSTNVNKDTLYTPAETKALNGLSEEAKGHRMYVTDECGNYYHLNPELVHGDVVTLCTRCATSPRGSSQSVFSIANGYDPGLRKHLSASPRRSTRRCIAALRVFKSAKLNVLDRERRGHVILFPSNAPPKVAARLPWTEDVLPTVTFYGAPTRWGGCSAHLDSHLSVDPEEVYEYLKVLKVLHEDYELLPIVPEAEGKAQLRSCVASVMHPSDDTLNAGSHVGTDGGEGSFLIMESAMMEPVAGQDTVAEVVEELLEKTDTENANDKGESSSVKGVKGEPRRRGIVYDRCPVVLTLCFLKRPCRQYRGRQSVHKGRNHRRARCVVQGSATHIGTSISTFVFNR